MSIVHEAYLFEPSDFAREVLPYAKALANSPDGIKKLLDHVIERFEESSSIRALAIEYGGWDISDLYRDKFSYENPVETQQGDRVNFVFLLGLMVYGHLHPVPSQLGLGGRWDSMESVLKSPLHWHSTDVASVIHGHSFGYFAQLWIANDLGTADNQATIPPNLDYWEHVTTGSTAAQIGWLDYPDVSRFLDKLASEESKLSIIETPNDPGRIKLAYDDTLKMLRAASEAGCGLCIITSG